MLIGIWTYLCVFVFAVLVSKVSGEYSMLVNGAAANVFDLDAVMWESLHALRRAGTDVIITYFTPKILKQLAA